MEGSNLETKAKLFILTSFAMFGLMLNPSVFASDTITDTIEMNQYSHQEETYLIQYRHKTSGKEIVQVFTNKGDYKKRLTELNGSSSHAIDGEKIVRNGQMDMFLTQIEVG